MWENIVTFFTADGFIYELLLSFLPIAPLLRMRKWAALRITGCALALILLACATYPYCVEQNPEPFSASLWYVALAVLTFGAVWLCFEGDVWNALFFAMSAYVIQHLHYRFSMLWEFVLHRCGVPAGNWLYVFTYFLGMLAVFTFCYFFFTRRLKKEKGFRANNIKLLLSTMLIILVLIILNLFTERELENEEMEFTYLHLFHILFGLVCGFVLLDSLYTNVYNRKLEEDIRIIQLLWQSDRRQYEMFRQNLDTMNIKYHDLKHQLGLRQGSANGKAGEKWVNEALDSLNIVGMMQKTGNDTLDVVLVQKHMQCDALGIELVTIVDGSLLNKLDDVDIYSLFGNALDNAIECLKGIEDGEKRTVTLTVRKVGEMAKIQVENYTPSPVEIVNGFPQTTKQDKLSHGYGVKSIAYIVEKYGGIMNFEASNHTFTLDIMLPL